MGDKRPKYRLGRIIGAYLRTRKGTKELHPAVIVTPDQEIIQPADFDPRRGGENVVVVVGVSTKYALYNDPYVKLPFATPLHPVTGLNKDCAAIIGWYDLIHIEDDCTFKAGDVPRALMTQINERIRSDLLNRLGKEYKTMAEIVPILFPGE
ncbi:MAG: hypothetical protein JWL69_4131 [Phycisphaerales bacterium]|nr:hypothetical protein [Phycisphaerales bacterium]MDB5354163.1 hypothetical protein [Phycisphaerales bacterium]